MSRKIRSLAIILVILGISLTLSVQGMTAQAPLSPRQNPEFQSKISGVVAFDPYKVSSQLFPFNPSNFKSLSDWLLAVPQGPNVLANQDLTDKAQNEPSIAVNPENPNHVIASSNDYRLQQYGGDVRAGYYVSFDGGNTWPGDGVIDISSIPNTNAAGDPAMAIHDVNNVYYGYIAFSRNQDDAGGIFVSKSTDGGLSWNNPVLVALNTLSVFHDKDYIAVDASGSPYDGYVYVTWTRFEYAYPIYFSRSTDGGASFSPGVEISGPGYSYDQGSIPVVGPNGELYVFWQNYNVDSIRFNKSLDGGQTWGNASQVAAIAPLNCPLPGGNFRCDSFPAAAVDPTNGYLYVAWADERNGDADIYYTRSTDGGSTWSTATRLNDDPVGNDFHQFFPWMDTAPNGDLYVGWFDSRNDPNPYAVPFMYDEYVTRSTDHGATFEPNTRISEVSSSAEVQFSGQFIGDYSGLAATNNFVFPAWVDARRGNQDIYTQENPNLVEASKTAPADIGRFQPFTYQIQLSSANSLVDNTLSDPLPPEVLYVPGSAWASSGIVTETGSVISWSGSLSSTLPVTITFDVTPTAFCGTSIVNTAVFTDGLGSLYDLQATSLISGALPVADFTPSDPTPEAGQVVTFTNQSSGGVGLSFLWDFGDGVTSTLESPTHIFTSAGSFTINLTASDNCGFATHQQMLDVTCQAPLPAFTWAGGELAYTFTNQTTGLLPLQYVWDFGDGLTSTLESPTHTFSIPASYTVTLTASNYCGTASTFEVVGAVCSAPTAGFEWSANWLQATFTNTSSGRFDLSNVWDFGDSLTSTLTSPVHDYALPLVYTVTLTTVDLCGSDSFTSLVSATCPAPEAFFTWVASGLAVSFTNGSSGSTPLSFEWDFGDGVTSTLESPAHTYAHPGTYTVHLTVNEACGVNEYEVTLKVGSLTFLPYIVKH